MRASEFISEYWQGKDIFPAWISGRLDQGNKAINDPRYKIMNDAQSPIKEYKLRWVSEYSPIINVFVYDSNDQCIAYFGAYPVEKKFLHTPTKPGVQILNPEIMISVDYRKKRIGSRLFTWYLSKYDVVFAEYEHTAGAQGVYDSAGRSGMQNMYFDTYTGQVPRSKGAIKRRNVWRFIGRPELFRDLKS